MEDVKHVKLSDAKKHRNSPQCTVYEYPMDTSEISIGVAEITGRYPDEGYALNHACSEMGFILEGKGTLVTEKRQIDLFPGDVVYIPPGEKFYWEGNFKVVLPTSPAWSPQQHELVPISEKVAK